MLRTFARIPKQEVQPVQREWFEGPGQGDRGSDRRSDGGGTERDAGVEWFDEHVDQGGTDRARHTEKKVQEVGPANEESNTGGRDRPPAQDSLTITDSEDISSGRTATPVLPGGHGAEGISAEAEHDKPNNRDDESVHQSQYNVLQQLVESTELSGKPLMRCLLILAGE